jgi:hypothetical protein
MSEAPPDDELRALIEMEKDAIVDPGPARARLAARLGPLLVAPPPGPPPAPPAAPSPSVPSGLTGWKLAAAGLGTFVLGGATGAIIHATTTPARTEVRYVDRIVEIEAGVDASAPAPSASAAPPALTPSERAPRVERPQQTSAPTDEALARERQIIEKARSALLRGDAEAALGAVAEHSKAFPRGQLGEAREAIAVQALVRAGRHDEARARAAKFHRAFPGSTYAPVVDGAISSIP